MNTSKYPRRVVDDFRVQKEVAFENSCTIRSVDLIAKFFSIASYQNITQLGTTQYSLSGATLTYLGVDSFQQVTNSNSASFLYSPQQIEIAAHFNF